MQVEQALQVMLKHSLTHRRYGHTPYLYPLLQVLSDKHIF